MKSTIFENLKKITLPLVALTMLCGFFASCANDLNVAEAGEKTSRALIPESECTAEIKLYLIGADSKKTWYTWAWIDKVGNYGADTWGKFTNKLTTDADESRALSVKIKVKPKSVFQFLFVAEGGNPQTADFKIEADNIGEGGQSFYFIYGDGTIYDSVDDCLGLKSASITTKDGKTVVASVLTGGETPKKENFTVTDSTGKALTVDKVDYANNVATLTLSNANIANRPYKVTYDKTTVTVNITMDLIDGLGMNYTGDDLGLTLSGSTATFKAWAPTASDVKVLLYTDATKIGKQDQTNGQAGPTTSEKMRGTPDSAKDMTSDGKTGVWTAENVDVSSYKYYKYQITVDGTTYYVADIWHTVASEDSVASQIANIDDASTKPAGWDSDKNPWTGNGYTDAVIYEMHIRDWSRAFVPDSTGKFKEITANLGDGEFAKHLKDLGITHVQILPMFDYAQTNDNENYNWGYNPYHYNVPEGRYVDYGGANDGTKAMLQMREMIKAFHDAGIAVIMDVVYNHTSGTKAWSLYDSTVPGYFYRMKDGSYSNGSGCGNEVATNHKMVKKYVIDSLKHWMNDYHINGFRFDLMGVHEKGTMKEIYDALYGIDEKVMVYGEPWTGGDSAVVSGATSATKGANGMGAGAFDDDFRDAIKGAEFGGLQLGHVQGKYNDDGIIKGLTGKSGKNARNTTGLAGLALHYVECHDNYTLADKLWYSTVPGISGDEVVDKFPKSLTDEQLDLVKKQNKLCAAYVMLSQGTPFINGGQEFMRTKQGNPDSCAADKKGGKEWSEEEVNKCNTVDLKMKETYADVYRTYKGLIHLRRDFNAFRNANEASATTIATGVTKYTVSKGADTFIVLFNASDVESPVFSSSGSIMGIGVRDFSTEIGLKGKQVLIGDDSEKGYTISKDETTVKSVPAHSFVVLKK